jgi:hypothetical protein
LWRHDVKDGVPGKKEEKKLSKNEKEKLGRKEKQ